MKKFVIIGLVFLMLASSITVAYAEVQPSNLNKNELEGLVTKTKKQLNISKEYKEFDVSVEQDDRGLTSYYMTWYDPDSEESISASVRRDGFIYRYYHNSPQDLDDGKISIDYKRAKTVAEDALNQINKELKSQVALAEDQESFSIYDTSYQFLFYRTINGISHKENFIRIGVNKTSYQVDSYYAKWDYEDEKNLKPLTYPEPKNLLSLEKAKVSFLEHVGLKKYYTQRIDYNNEGKRTISYLPIWVTNEDYRTRGIDAFTGDLVWYYPEEDFYGAESSAPVDTKEVSDEASLTDVEMEEIDKIRNLKPQAEAEKKIRELFAISDDYEVTSSRLMLMGSNTDRYYYEINFRSNRKFIYTSIDAINLDVLSYNTEDYDNEKETLDYTKAESLARAEMKRISPNYLKEFELMEPKSKEKSSYYNFSFIRKVKDVYVPNYISVTINGHTGKLVDYSFSYFHGDLPTFPKNLTQEEVAKKLFDQFPPELAYVKGDDDKIHLVYTINDNAYTRLDAITGLAVDEEGREIQETNCEYEDFADIQEGEKIKILCQHGICYQGQKFDPTGKLLQKDFLPLFASMLYLDANRPLEDLVKDLVSRGLLLEGEVKNKGEDPMTRRLAVRMFVREMGYTKIAKLNDIYKDNLFKDAGKLKEDLGYFNLAYALGLIEKDAQGQVNPDALLTREEGALLIYNKLFD